MLGITDPVIYSGYLFSILCLCFCLIYGIKNWNKGQIDNLDQMKKDLEWEREEEKRERQL